MLYCPWRLPKSFSNRLPGGTRMSSKHSAASNSNNFLKAFRRISEGNFDESL
jgi:hypothetical protein